jgi:aminopeptidase N
MIKLEDYKAPEFKIASVHLEFALDPEATIVTSTLKMVSDSSTLTLDGDELVLLSVELNGKPVDHVVTPTSLTLNVPFTPFTLVIKTQINPTANTALSGLYRSNGTYCTQCEAEGFRRITFFPDRPDVLTTYTVKITGKEPLLLSNGNQLEHGVWHDPHPKPSYLFALVAGDLGVVKDTFTTMSGRVVALEIYVEHGKEPLCAYAMDSLKRSMRWDETAFGREYDLDVFMIVAVSDFNMGAMENKGLNIFNDKYVLANPETATDADYANIEGIIAHEYFHNWTGNRITCRDWFQLSLKEGLTVFRDQEFSSDMRSRPVKRIEDVRLLKSAQFAEDAGPLSHPVRPRQYAEINNFYTATVYNKGAEVIRMMKVLIGEKAFADGLDLYFKRHDGQATTIELFVKCFEEVAERSLDIHSRWYEQAGTPLVRVSTEYEGGVLILHLEQVLREGHLPQSLPLRVGFLSPNGEELFEETITLDQFKGRFIFEDFKDEPILSLNRGFSAAVNIDYGRSDQTLAFLATHDSDDYNRRQAVETYALKVLTKGADAAPFIALYGKLIEESPRDPAFYAHALTLPSEEDIAREIGANINPDAIKQTRNTLVVALAKAHAERASALFHTLQTGAFSPDAASAGKRSLRIALLRLMVIEGFDASEIYMNADNLTERFGALACVVHHGNVATRDKLMADFQARFEDNANVFDKYLSLTGMKASVLEVKTMLQGAVFTKFNPNRYRALVGVFAMSNPTQFHTKAGYDFLCEELLRVDKINPQVSARVANAFRSYKSMEEPRKLAAHEALLALSKHELSNDLKDIITRMLA